MLISYNRDYRAIPALDRYDGGELDESDYDAISESGRREAERAMRKRDQEMGVGDMRRGLFYGKFCFGKCCGINYNLLFLLDESDEDDDSRPARKRRLAERAAEGMEMKDDQV